MRLRLGGQKVEKKKFYQKTWFLWVCGLLIPIIGIVLIWTVHKEKSKGFKIGLTAVFTIWLLIAFAMNHGSGTETTDVAVEIQSENSDNTAEEKSAVESTQEAVEEANKEISVEDSTDENTKKREAFDNAFADSAVIFDEAVRNDKTGKWRMYRTSANESIVDHAVDYYKAYFSSDDELHWFINFHPQQKSTTAIRVLDDKTLSLTVHEYVDKEEHDASILGSGNVIAEYLIDIESGKQAADDIDESAGTVTSDELIAAVKEAIDGQIGKGERYSDISFDGKDLTVKVDLSGADTSILTRELIAESRTSSITDGILQLDDKYYNTWNTMTIDFGDIGSISFDKSAVKDGGLGRYVEVPVAYFE